jgi:hypothetical protein
MADPLLKDQMPFDEWVNSLTVEERLKIVSIWLNENLAGRNHDSYGTVLCGGENAYWLDLQDIAKVADY